MENDDSIANKNLEEYDNKVNIDKASSIAITAQEADEDADDSILVSDVQTEEQRKRKAIQKQYNQSHQLTNERIRFQDFKQRNMEEFTNDYSISQVVPSGWTTFFNVLSTIFFTFTVIIAICIAICFIFRVSIGVVPTNSMEPTIPVGSLIFYKPVSQEDIDSSLKKSENAAINMENKILCYSRGDMLYVHRLYNIIINENGEKCYVMVGDNKEECLDEDLKPKSSDTISYSEIKGELVFCVHNIGYIIYFIKNNFLLTLSIFSMFIFAIMLFRNIIERNHAREELEMFVDKKAELEKQNEAKLEDLQKEASKREFERILQTDYSQTPEQDNPVPPTVAKKPDEE